MSYQPPAGPPPEWSQAGPPPPAKKRKKWPFIVAGIVVLIVIISVASQGGKSDDSSTTADSSTAPTTATVAPQSGQAAPPPAVETTTTTTKAKAKHTLVYEVTSDSGTANNITYFGIGGNQSQETEATLPFRKEITSDSKSDFTIKGVTAQNGGDGAITCKIIVDGKVETENSSNGQYAVVSCTGKLF